ncbi:HMG domain-containing protein 4-like isoform X3 [Leopardus geoffroyi]|uniref:HMG domain-containing protein 4-like isoform X3 n=1 Tax=Leopardus geoffroyi TaxID=46844 RepID=UPI001E2656E1|nr:HMG domain-containing protein 4-like isoform X3 [Leopardus geoffroyi]
MPCIIGGWPAVFIVTLELIFTLVRQWLQDTGPVLLAGLTIKSADFLTVTAQKPTYTINTPIPVMKNLLRGLSRKMRLSRKTVYQMYQATNMPGNFWLTHQLKDFGCHSGKKSKLCSAHEDPMYDIIRENKRHEKDIRIQQLKQLLEDSTSDEDGSSSSSSECKEKHKKKKKKEKHKKRKKEKKKKKKRKHKSSKSNESSDSD